MNELYFGAYQWDDELQLMTPLCDDFIAPIALDQLPIELNANKTNGAGNGWRLHEQLSDTVKNSVKDINAAILPSAEYLLPDALKQWKEGQLLQPEDVELVYLREQSHWKTIKEQKQLKS